MWKILKFKSSDILGTQLQYEALFNPGVETAAPESYKCQVSVVVPSVVAKVSFSAPK